MSRVRRSCLLPALLTCLALAGCGAEPPVDFRVPALGGGLVGPGDFAGRVVVLDFWATWCVPCRAQAMVLESLYDELQGPDVEFLAVNVGEEEELVRDFVRDRPFTYPVLIDPKDTLMPALGIEMLPTVMVLDRSGRAVFSRPGLSTARELRRVLARAIAAPAGR